jgi:hypothetical protein
MRNLCECLRRSTVLRAPRNHNSNCLRNRVVGDSAESNAASPSAEDQLTAALVIKYSLDEKFTIVNRKIGDTFSKHLATQPPLDTAGISGWRNALTLPSLPESHRTIKITQGSSWFRKILAFAKMGEFVNSRVTAVIAWGVTAAILFFNAELLWLTLRPY